MYIYFLFQGFPSEPSILHSATVRSSHAFESIFLMGISGRHEWYQGRIQDANVWLVVTGTMEFYDFPIYWDIKMDINELMDLLFITFPIYWEEGNVIIPTDFHSIIFIFFSEGWRKTTNQILIVSHRNWMYIPLEPLNRHFGHV